jgi:hypothetical protein
MRLPVAIEATACRQGQGLSISRASCGVVRTLRKDFAMRSLQGMEGYRSKTGGDNNKRMLLFSEVTRIATEATGANLCICTGNRNYAKANKRMWSSKSLPCLRQKLLSQRGKGRSHRFLRPDWHVGINVYNPVNPVADISKPHFAQGRSFTLTRISETDIRSDSCSR